MSYIKVLDLNGVSVGDFDPIDPYNDTPEHRGEVLLQAQYEAGVNGLGKTILVGAGDYIVPGMQGYQLGVYDRHFFLMPGVTISHAPGLPQDGHAAFSMGDNAFNVSGAGRISSFIANGFEGSIQADHIEDFNVDHGTCELRVGTIEYFTAGNCEELNCSVFGAIIGHAHLNTIGAIRFVECAMDMANLTIDPSSTGTLELDKCRITVDGRLIVMSGTMNLNQ